MVLFFLEFSFFGFLQIDLKKMPLGKLSKKQIETAYACLGDCQKVLKKNVFKNIKSILFKLTFMMITWRLK